MFMKESFFFNCLFFKKIAYSVMQNHLIRLKSEVLHNLELDIVTHICNLCMQKGEVKGLPWVCGQPRLHRKILFSHPCLLQKKARKTITNLVNMDFRGQYSSIGALPSLLKGHSFYILTRVRPWLGIVTGSHL